MMPILGKRLAVLLLCVATVSTATTFGQSRPDGGQIEAPAATPAAQSTPSASTNLSIRGTIDTYHASTEILSLSTANGRVEFHLASAAHLLRGRQKIDAPALGKLSGYWVVVRYSEIGGHKTVASVHVFEKSERTQR